MNKGIKEKFSKTNGPKRILALDGGGIRGALTLGYLEKIEQLLRKRYNDNNLVLADYYDLIGGTSTGSIISALLAVGKPVKDIVSMYQNLGKEVFGKRRYPVIPRSWTTFRAFFTSAYKGEIIEDLLKNNLGDITLCDYEKLKCPITIISKRADTFSLWTVANHPDGVYTKAMSHLKLWELCRASSAAPYYFPAKKLSLKTRQGENFDAAFIDGGISLANNPAIQLFLTATIPSFGFDWASGEENIFITSLGTGNGVNKDSVKDILSRKTLSWSPKLPELFMTDALEMNEVMMQILGKNYGDAEAI
ncbi:MAG TPA: patatin-like phospholipase family protein, partial [Chitinophagaceae bacterium]